jgi:thioredoxin-like negative regulator of GroEL
MSSEAVTAGIEQETPRLLFFYEQRSGKSRRADGFLAHVLQRGHNHQTFVIHRVEVGQRPDLAQRFKVTATPTLLVVEDKKVQARLESPTGCEDIELLLRPWLQSRNGVQPRPAPQHPPDPGPAALGIRGGPHEGGDRFAVTTGGPMSRTSHYN